MSTITLQIALDNFESLPDEDQRTLVKILEKRLIEKSDKNIGNYTEERKELLKDITFDELISNLKRDESI